MAEGCPPAASGIPGVAVPPVSSAVTRVSPQGRDACHRAGSRPVGPEGAAVPGARAAPGRPAGCWCPVEENTPVTMLGGARAARCHPGATLYHPVPAARAAAMATAARPGTAERPQRPRAGMERLPASPTASLIGCHAVGNAHSLTF